MQDVDRYLDELDQDPEIHAIKAQLTVLESQLRPLVSEEAWMLFLKWESLWAELAVLYVTRLYPQSDFNA
ncbi:hypothetical protein [Tumebacillus permanentifrigoris]|uniref:Uncharacterized protein n=1 Tax=Tumebacillus permanentifrigoris TaxID=378543 RepID=A0A316D4K3_9BACL|nr:hypothetical protein [Tumebacillus permanentifrigoris]PWK04980.1 hypothetical protein C7459_1319 [Tumebacillus permanentifrigoris]